MDRRGFLKLLSAGLVGHTLDVDKLLWVPGQKTIFLPSEPKLYSMSEIVALELEYMLPKIQKMFTADAKLYEYLKSDLITNISGIRADGWRVPLKDKL